MNISGTYLYLITAIACVAALAAAIAAGWLVHDLNKKHGILNELQFAYEAATERSAYAASVRTLLRDIESEREKLESIATQADPVEIIRAIENAGKAARVSLTVQAVNPAAPHPKDPSLISLTIALSANGTFKELYHFVALLETLPLPTIVEAVKFEKSERVWNAEIGLRIFTEENASLAR